MLSIISLWSEGKQTDVKYCFSGAAPSLHLLPPAGEHWVVLIIILIVIVKSLLSLQALNIQTIYLAHCRQPYFSIKRDHCWTIGSNSWKKSTLLFAQPKYNFAYYKFIFCVSIYIHKSRSCWFVIQNSIVHCKNKVTVLTCGCFYWFIENSANFSIEDKLTQVKSNFVFTFCNIVLYLQNILTTQTVVCQSKL